MKTTNQNVAYDASVRRHFLPPQFLPALFTAFVKASDFDVVSTMKPKAALEFLAAAVPEKTRYHTLSKSLAYWLPPSSLTITFRRPFGLFTRLEGSATCDSWRS